jgi:hypothetical protein
MRKVGRKILGSLMMSSKYICTGICEDNIFKEKIDTLHKTNLYKIKPMPNFPYN